MESKSGKFERIALILVAIMVSALLILLFWKMVKKELDSNEVIAVTSILQILVSMLLIGAIYKQVQIANQQNLFIGRQVEMAEIDKKPVID
ncbi:hypothetical protein DRO97_07880, partial [Archaeoglobales archaeon]